MNNFKGTPGPWKIGIKNITGRSPDRHGYIEIDAAQWQSLAVCYRHEINKSDEEAMANAKLISCAPQMLEMLKESRLQIQYLHEKFQETGSGNSVLSRIDSLIEKATK